MIQQFQKQRSRRVPSFKEFLRMGGTAGMVRTIIHRWERPFNINQIKVALHRRYPELITAESQIEDIVSELVRRGKLERVDQSTFRHAKHPVAYPRFVKAAISPRKRQLKFIFQ